MSESRNEQVGNVPKTPKDVQELIDAQNILMDRKKQGGTREASPEDWKIPDEIREIGRTGIQAARDAFK